jgi:hypothetical protein
MSRGDRDPFESLVWPGEHDLLPHELPHAFAVPARTFGHGDTGRGQPLQLTYPHHPCRWVNVPVLPHHELKPDRGLERG